MRLAFAIVSFFPWGGLQRDCLRLARAATDAGHEVTIFTARTRGELPSGLDIRVLPVRAVTNHGRNRRFGRDLRATVGNFDGVIGFDKMPGLDVLYCADMCFADRKQGFWSKLNPRHRAMVALEAACFGQGSRTRVLALAERQIAGYRRAWGTPAQRIMLLPPPIDLTRRHPEFRHDGTRESVRANLGLGGTLVWLAVGGWPRTKGFDRIVAAFPAAEQALLLICGVDAQSRAGADLLRQARSLGVTDRIRLLGSREDVPQLMAAADLFVHPARTETTGTVILEAIINGLPAVVTEECGFSYHVRDAEAGIVIPEPFTSRKLIDALQRATEPSRREAWSRNAAAYGANPELYSGIDKGLAVIIEAAENRIAT
jgi:UDP-glucose:(heptosyl)LPS alpha-1,3-glucosyltransferase